MKYVMLVAYILLGALLILFLVKTHPNWFFILFG